MEFTGLIKDLTVRVKKLKLKPHTQVVVNGDERFWYGSKLMTKYTYDNLIQRQKLVPVEYVIIQSSKQYDKDHRLFFDLCVEDVLRMRLDQKDICLYCNTPMQIENRTENDGLTIERRDPTLGHTRENCVLTCWECNCVVNIGRTIRKMKTNTFFKQFVLNALRD